MSLFGEGAYYFLFLLYFLFVSKNPSLTININKTCTWWDFIQKSGADSQQPPAKSKLGITHDWNFSLTKYDHLDIQKKKYKSICQHNIKA